MAVTETPPETVAAASSPTPVLRVEPRGLAAVLGTGDHKVIGRLYVATSLVFGLAGLVLSGLFAAEMLDTSSIDIFTDGTVLQAFTLTRLGLIFLVAIPLLFGVAMVVVPLQVGARSIAFPRAAAASYWAWLLGSLIFIGSYLGDGGPGGGNQDTVLLWIAGFGLVVTALVLAAICLATTVLALRTTGLTLSRTPLYAWSVAIAAIMWILTLPVLLAQLVLFYVDLRHSGSGFTSGADMYGQIGWALRNPQIYLLAVPVIGFAADALATTARARVAPRLVAIGAIGAFGAFGFGAFLFTGDLLVLESPVTIAFAFLAVLPVLLVLALAGDLFRRGGFRLTTGALYAVSSVTVLLVTVLAGALGSIPATETAGTIYDMAVSHGTILAIVIASLGGLHWWAVKIGRQPAAEGPGKVAPLALLVGSLAAIAPGLIAGLSGEGTELSPSWEGGIEGLNLVGLIGVALIAVGVLAAAAAFLPLIRQPDTNTTVASDPWEGQTLEWLTPSPPPLANFTDDIAAVASAEPLIDLREEK